MGGLIQTVEIVEFSLMIKSFRKGLPPKTLVLTLKPIINNEILIELFYVILKENVDLKYQSHQLRSASCNNF